MIFFHDFFVVIASAVIVLAWLTVLTEEVRRDDLPVLATCRSGTSAILFSTSNGPVAYGSAQ